MDQPPSSTLSGFTPEALTDKNPQGKIEMVFRFWGGNGRSAETGEGGSTNQLGSQMGHHPGVLALIEDAVASKRGVFVSTQEYLYISRLKRPADALVVSRQVQLGLEGFRARHGSGPVSVSIAIDAGGGEGAHGVEAAGQEPPHDLVTLLKLSKPAQILLTHDLCQQVTGIRGLPLRSFPARFGVYEYLWTAEEKLDLLQSEPQLTLAALPMAPAKEKTGAGNTMVGAAASATKAFEAPGAPAAAAVEPAAQKKGLPRLYIFGGTGLAAVVVLAAIGIHMAQKPAANPAQGPAQSPAPAPIAAPVASPPAQPAAQVPAPVAAPAVAKPHAPPNRTAAKPVATPAPTPTSAQDGKTPAAPSADCALGGQIPQYVGLGEQARGRGDYANAIRIFREVLACDPNNAAAKEGLAKAMQAQQQPD